MRQNAFFSGQGGLTESALQEECVCDTHMLVSRLRLEIYSIQDNKGVIVIAGPFIILVPCLPLSKLTVRAEGNTSVFALLEI